MRWSGRRWMWRMGCVHERSRLRRCGLRLSIQRLLKMLDVGRCLSGKLVIQQRVLVPLSNQSETGPAAVVDSETEVRNCWDNCQNLDVESPGSSCRSIARMGTWPHRCRKQVKSSTNVIHPVLHARIRDQAQRPSALSSLDPVDSLRVRYIRRTI